MKIQIRMLAVLLILTMNFGIVGCGANLNESQAKGTVEQPKPIASNAQTVNNEKSKEFKIKVTAGARVLTATLIDNATTRDLVAKFPLTVPMRNLYAREMVYRLPSPLPANEAERSGYEVGDLSYWTPGHSLVIFYEQNAEVINSLQKIGRFDSNLDFFKSIEAVDVRFENQ